MLIALRFMDIDMHICIRVHTRTHTYILARLISASEVHMTSHQWLDNQTGIRSVGKHSYPEHHSTVKRSQITDSCGQATTHGYAIGGLKIHCYGAISSAGNLSI